MRSAAFYSGARAVQPRKGAKRTIDFKAGLSPNPDRSAPKFRDVIAIFSQSQLHCLGWHCSLHGPSMRVRASLFLRRRAAGFSRSDSTTVRSGFRMRHGPAQVSWASARSDTGGTPAPGARIIDVNEYRIDHPVRKLGTRPAREPSPIQHGNLDSAAVGQLGVDTAFDEQFVAGIDFA